MMNIKQRALARMMAWASLPIAWVTSLVVLFIEDRIGCFFIVFCVPAIFVLILPPAFLLHETYQEIVADMREKEREKQAVNTSVKSLMDRASSAGRVDGGGL